MASRAEWAWIDDRMIHYGHILYSHSYCPVPIEKSKLAGELSDMGLLNREQLTPDRLALKFREPGCWPKEDSVQWIAQSGVFSAHFHTQLMAVVWDAAGMINFVVPQSLIMFDQSPMLVRRFVHGFSFFLRAGFCAPEAWFAWRYLSETKNRSREEIPTWWSTP